MPPLILDMPLIRRSAFFPRHAAPRSRRSDVLDGAIPIEKNGLLGYRFFVYKNDAPVIVYFHGNGEIAADYDDVANYYRDVVKVSLLVLDYRGYGWSTGTPTFKTLLSDTERIHEEIRSILDSAHLELGSCPLYIMGRSIGSAPAIHLAYTHPQGFRGLIIESGFATIFSAVQSIGFPLSLVAKVNDGLGNVRKLRSLSLPLLVIHGAQDRLLPIAQGRKLYQAAATTNKTFVKVAGADHNSVMSTDIQHYFAVIAEFIQRTM